MTIPAQFAPQLAAFPAVLRELVEAELEAGNEIAEISHGFPAAPIGASVKLARPVDASRRKSARGVNFYDRNTSIYAGEFTDAQRFFFVLEPPRPPEPPPDMDAIRAAFQERERVANADRFRGESIRASSRAKSFVPAKSSRLTPSAAPAAPPKIETAVDRFRESMVATYERWHDGIGYDLDILTTATPEELVEIEELLVERGADDWRDVEALAALGSPRARVALRQALRSSNHHVRTAVLRHAPGLVSDAERTAALVAALEGAEIYGGLTQALLQVVEFHPPEVIETLLRGVLARSGDTAVHFAAMLMFIYGRAKTSFDWDQRPFFLAFNTDDRDKRRERFRDLCRKIGVDPAPYLDGSGTRR